MSESSWKRAAKILRRDEFAALWLKQAEDRKIPEIARLMSCSIFYVRYLLFRARRKLLGLL